MQIKQVKVTFRVPTVKYGYEDWEYSCTLDEESESIENVVRYLREEHYDALQKSREDERPKAWEEQDVTIPF